MFGGGSTISKWRKRMKWARRLVLLGSLAGGAQKWLRQKRASSPAPAPRQLAAAKPATVTATATTTVTDSATPMDVRATTRWVAADGTEAPAGYPVKVNTRSGIYHVEGGLAYERTRPDRWYRSAADAEADGFRPSKI